MVVLDFLDQEDQIRVSLAAVPVQEASSAPEEIQDSSVQALMAAVHCLQPVMEDPLEAVSFLETLAVSTPHLEILAATFSRLAMMAQLLPSLVPVVYMDQEEAALVVFTTHLIPVPNLVEALSIPLTAEVTVDSLAQTVEALPTLELATEAAAMVAVMVPGQQPPAVS